MYAIELSDGSKLENLILSGNVFYSTYEVNDATFAGKLRRVKITTDETEEFYPDLRGEHGVMSYELLGHTRGQYLFALHDVDEAELERERLKSNVEYIALMSDIDLE